MLAARRSGQTLATRRGARERRRRGRGAYLTRESPILTVVSRDAKDPATGAEKEVDLGHPGAASKVGIGRLRTSVGQSEA